MWDYAKFPNRRPLKELVSLVSGGVTAIDEELKQLSNSYGEKQVALQDAKRRKGGNLLSVDLNDVLDEKIFRGLQIHDTEYLMTVFVACGKTQREGFEKEIYNMGGELVGYGGESFYRWLLSIVPLLWTIANRRCFLVFASDFSLGHSMSIPLKLQGRTGPTTPVGSLTCRYLPFTTVPPTKPKKPHLLGQANPPGLANTTTTSSVVHLHGHYPPN